MINKSTEQCACYMYSRFTGILSFRKSSLENHALIQFTLDGIKFALFLNLFKFLPQYLYNLDVNSAFYDPKTRSMRENPFQGKEAKE